MSFHLNASFSQERCAVGKGTFGQRLKQERIRRGFRLHVFADAVGVNATQITGYENRGVMPTFQSVIAIAQVLDCSIDWLAGLED